MMASLNKTLLIGHLGKDPESRYMPNGDAVVNITLATTDTWKDKQTGDKKEATADDRFWSKVKKSGRTECWLWQGAKKPSGYGNIRRNKQYTTAHRLAWELSFGAIPKGMQIQHSCDTPSCCNPNHLMLGTVVSNYIDMCKKGRSKSNHKNRKFGINNHNSKLSEEQVEEIRRKYIPGKIRQRDLADSYGVSQRLISIITRNEGRTHG